MAIISVSMNTLIVLLMNAACIMNPVLSIPVFGTGNAWFLSGRTVSDAINQLPQQQLIINNGHSSWQNSRFPSVNLRGNLFLKLMPYSAANSLTRGISRGSMGIPFSVQRTNRTNVIVAAVSNNTNNDTINAFKIDKINVNETVDDLTFNGSKSNQHASANGSSEDSKPFQFNPVLNLGLSQDKSKRISEIKCEEYGRRMGRSVLALALVGIGSNILSTKEGGSKCPGVRNPLIVGGTTAQEGEFPHMAALGWRSVEGKVQYLCGGTLISERWVVTAAHCTHGYSGSPTVVRLGAHRLSDRESGQLFEIESIKRHPGYSPPAMYADIALLKLKTPIMFGDYIGPACLYPEYDVVPSPVWATGWGATEIGEERSDKLLKARLEILDNVDCALRHNRSSAVPRGVVPNMVCAGDPNGGWKKDTCQGDSGGPLQVVHPTNKCLYQLVGITSFGKLCALPEYPGVYTRVSHYLDWIERIVWPEEKL